MSDEVNKNPLPPVVKGSGFYTSMDLAPGEVPSDVSTPSESTIAEMAGQPTTMANPPDSSQSSDTSTIDTTSDGE